MKYLDIEYAIACHDAIIAEVGGLGGVLNTTLLAGAMEHIKNDDFYPTFIEKLAHLMFCCVQFHPFTDGNKRTALFLGRAFVVLNFPHIEVGDFYERLEDVVVGIAKGEVSKDGLRGILREILELV